MQFNTDEQPATVRLVNDVRKELKSDIASLEAKMNSEFSSVRSLIEKQNSSIQSIAVSVERTRIDVRMVLDGYINLSTRVDALEKNN